MALEHAYALHLERLVRHPTVSPALPSMAWINEPKEVETESPLPRGIVSSAGGLDRLRLNP